MRDLPPTVRRVAWLHFANDFTLDFVTPLLPAGVGIAWLGVMEGAADAAGQVLKLFTGRASDRSGRRVPWVAAGYATNAVARPLAGAGMLLGWPLWIVACRVADRVGKGVRGSATDALVADWTGEGQRARAFALARTMDHLGATAGGLAAAGAAWLLGPRVAWAVVGLAVVAAPVALLCRSLEEAPADEARLAEARAKAAEGDAAAGAGYWPRDPALRRPLAAIAVASLGAKVAPLLVLAEVAGLPEPGEAGAWPLWLVCLGWAALGLVQAGAAALAGRLTDRMGPASFLRAGWLAGAAVFGALALAKGPWLVAAGLAFGVMTGLTEGAEKTWIASLAPRSERAVAFGAMAIASAVAGLVGSGAAGWGLARAGPAVFLAMAGALLVGAALTIGSRRAAA